MRAFVVVPPDPVLTWEDADAHLKLSGDTSQQAEVEAMIAAATGMLDGPEAPFGRALGLQTIEARFDPWDADCRLKLPCRPIVSILSVKYLDSARTEITVAPADYELSGASVDFITSTLPWSSCLWARETIRVRYRAGYEVLPFRIRAAILLIVGDLYRRRDTVAENTAQALPIGMASTIENLLAGLQVYG